MLTLVIVNYADREEYPNRKMLRNEFETYDALEKWVYLNCPKWTSVVITLVREKRDGE